MIENSNANPTGTVMANLADESVTVLKSNWDLIQGNRDAISEELTQLAKRAAGVNRTKIEELCRWFKTERSYEESLLRQDVLAVCLPLCGGTDDTISKQEIARSCRVASCSAGREVSASRKILRALFYPFLVLLGAAALAIAFSHLISPEFETMFGEFGIELPFATNFVMGFSRMIRGWSWVLGLWLLGGFLIATILNQATRRNRPGELSWLESQFLTSRDALASWTWHLSLLLEAGLSQREAVKTAGQAASKSWIRRLSIKWSQRTPIPPSDRAAFFESKKYRMLDYALQLPMSSGKIELLRETAQYYWDRNRNIADWWTQWLVMFLLLLIGLGILFVIVSLFMPLLAIVSGLTSVKF